MIWPATSVSSLIAIGTPLSGGASGAAAAVGGVGRGERLLGEHDPERVELRVQPRDPLEVELVSSRDDTSPSRTSSAWRARPAKARSVASTAQDPSGRDSPAMVARRLGLARHGTNTSLSRHGEPGCGADAARSPARRAATPSAASRSPCTTTCAPAGTRRGSRRTGCARGATSRSRSAARRARSAGSSRSARRSRGWSSTALAALCVVLDVAERASPLRLLLPRRATQVVLVAPSAGDALWTGSRRRAADAPGGGHRGPSTCSSWRAPTRRATGVAGRLARVPGGLAWLAVAALAVTAAAAARVGRRRRDAARRAAARADRRPARGGHRRARRRRRRGPGTGGAETEALAAALAAHAALVRDAPAGVATGLVLAGPDALRAHLRRERLDPARTALLHVRPGAARSRHPQWRAALLAAGLAPRRDGPRGVPAAEVPPGHAEAVARALRLDAPPVRTRPARRSSRARRGWRASRGSPRARAASPIRIRLTGTSSTLPESVRGTSAIARTSLGHVARRAVLAHAPADRGDEVVVELGAVAQHDEQRHPVLLAVARDVDDERVHHLVEREHGAVDLARPHAHAAAVDGRVRAAVDHRGPARRDADPVAVAPDAGVVLEVGLAQPRAVLVVPEGDRHRGHGLGEHELADLVDHARCRPRRRRAGRRRGRAPAARRGTRAARGSRRRTRCTRRSRPRSRTATCRRRRARRPTRTPRARAASPSTRRPAARHRSRPAAGSIPAFMHDAR